MCYIHKVFLKIYFTNPHICAAVWIWMQHVLLRSTLKFTMYYNKTYGTFHTGSTYFCTCLTLILTPWHHVVLITMLKKVMYIITPCAFLLIQNLVSLYYRRKLCHGDAHKLFPTFIQLRTSSKLVAGTWQLPLSLSFIIPFLFIAAAFFFSYLPSICRIKTSIKTAFLIKNGLNLLFFWEIMRKILFKAFNKQLKK